MRIAIVNDLRIATEAIRRALADAGAHTVAWTARDGAEAVEKCARDRPDLVLMDLVMPVMDGVEATRRIMAASPCAILVVTATMRGNSARVFEALGSGALDVVQTPSGAAGATLLLEKLDRMTKSILNQPNGVAANASINGASSSAPPVSARAVGPAGAGADFLIGIGASAGGPAALETVLANLPAGFPAAIVVVQHIDAAFTPGLVSWLEKTSRLPVRAAAAGDRPEPGAVFLATGDRHLVLDAAGRFAFTDEPAGASYFPSIDVFFGSLARHWRRNAAGVLLTGMGRDGAEGLLRVRRAGFPTLAQDRATSAVYGMPKAAAELGAAEEVLPLGDIAPRLRALVAARRV